MTNAALRAAFALALSAVLAGPAVAAPDDPDALIASRADGARGFGVILGVIDRGKTTIYTAGRLGPGGAPPDIDSVFEIGSVTKTFTAGLLALMVARGEVKLRDPIEGYLPHNVHAPAFEGRSITLLDLAEQRSGLPRDAANFTNAHAGYTEAQLFTFLSSFRLTRKPGTTFEYSNVGVGLLGDLLARRARVPYAELVRKRILVPLGMDASGIVVTPRALAHFAPGYTADGFPAQRFFLGALAGAGGMHASMRDMLTYLRAAMTDSRDQLHAAMEVAEQPRTPIRIGRFNEPLAIGLVWVTLVARGITWHNGGTAGYHAFIGFRRQTGRGVVLLTNQSQPIDDVGLHVLDRSFPLATPDLSQRIAPERLAAYAGDYRFSDGSTIRLEARGSILLAHTQDAPEFGLYPASATRFVAKIAPLQITFEVAADGAVTGFVLEQGDQKERATRIASSTTGPSPMETAMPTPSPASTPLSAEPVIPSPAPSGTAGP